MKITLKDTNTLVQEAKGTTTGIDDRLENFFRTYGGKTIIPTDFKVYQYYDKNGNVYQQFSFDFFPENMMYTNITIPDSWLTSYDLEENIDIIFCKACAYKANINQLYPFRDGKVVTKDDQGTDDVTDDTYSDVYQKTYKYFLDNELDLLCPICFSKNSFANVQ
jgi:hypothetical protein